MTIAQQIKKVGWNSVCDFDKPHRSMDVAVSFLTSEGIEETEFRITSFSQEELGLLFHEFCKENGLQDNQVTSITIRNIYEEKI